MDKMVLIIVGFVQLIVAVNSLKCYECIDCPTVTDTLIKECGSELVTIPPSSTTSLPSTVPHNSTTISPITTTQSVNSTTTTPSITVSPNSTTTSPITTPSANSTLPPNGTSTLPPTTVSSTNTTTTLTLTPSTNKTAQLLMGQNISRGKRDVSLLSAKNDLGELFGYRQRATVSYYCFKATVKHNATYNVVIRGCAQKYNKTRTLCDKVPEDIEVKACATCESDKCNGAFSMQLPFLHMFIMLSLAVTF